MALKMSREQLQQEREEEIAEQREAARSSIAFWNQDPFLLFYHEANLYTLYGQEVVVVTGHPDEYAQFYMLHYTYKARERAVGEKRHSWAGSSTAKLYYNGAQPVEPVETSAGLGAQPVETSGGTLQLFENRERFAMIARRSLTAVTIYSGLVFPNHDDRTLSFWCREVQWDPDSAVINVKVVPDVVFDDFRDGICRSLSPRGHYCQVTV